jgi:hypothetical protein
LAKKKWQNPSKPKNFEEKQQKGANLIKLKFF